MTQCQLPPLVIHRHNIKSNGLMPVVPHHIFLRPFLQKGLLMRRHKRFWIAKFIATSGFDFYKQK